MRDAFVQTLIEIAEKDDKLVLLMAEVGYGVVEPFHNRFPNRFYNTGISEQNLVLTACGMAIQGFHPVAYSMSSFLPSRAFEMIKDSVCYQNLPVTLVGIGSGISYGKLGSTHHAPEEYALMNCLPNMEVIFPANADECNAAMKYAVSCGGPCYIGLEKYRSVMNGSKVEFSKKWNKISLAQNVDKNVDVAIIACGYLTEMAVEIQKKLDTEQIVCDIYSAQMVKPLDTEAIRDACLTKRIVVLDEHYGYSGLAGEISRTIFENKWNKLIELFEEVSISDSFYNVVGSEDRLRAVEGLDVAVIVSKIIKNIK